MNYLDLDFLRTTKDAQRSSDFETYVREDVVSDRISENIFDTTSNRNIYNTPSTKITKFVESVPRHTNMRGSIRKYSRKKIQHLRNNRRLETEYKSNKTVRWRGKSGNSIIYDCYTLMRKFYKLMLKQNAKNRFVKGTHKTKIERRRCDNCNAQRRSYNVTNAAYVCKRNLNSTAIEIVRNNQEYIRSAETAKDDVGNIRDLTILADSPDEKLDDKDLNRDISIEYDWIGLENNLANAAYACKKNLKSTATAIMRDIQEYIRSAETAKDDVGNIRDLTIPADSPDEKMDDKDLNRDISIENDWIGLKNNGELNNDEMSSQNRYTIDCKFVDRMETTYRSVSHECDGFDSLLATSSLKMDMDESWRSEDSDEKTSHSSWRQSVSFTKECDKNFDSVLLLRYYIWKIVSDDWATDEKCYDDEHETLKSTCYKYNDTSDVYVTISKDTPVNNSCSNEKDMKFIEHKMKNISTYKKEGKDVWSSVQVDRKFVKSGNDEGQDITKNNKVDNTVHLMRSDPDNKATDLEYDSDKTEYVPPRITTTLIKTTNENHTGKLVWGSCSGWWPALIVDAEHVGMAPCSDKLWVFWIGEKQISLLTEKTQIQPFSKNLQHRLKEPSRKLSSAIDATMQILCQRFNCTLTKPYYHLIQRNITEFESLDDLTFYPYPKNIQESLDTLKETNIKTTENDLFNQRRLPKATSIKEQIIEQHKGTNTSWKEIDDERLLFQDQNPGEIAWAKTPEQRWWPVMIIDYRGCSLEEPSLDYQWVMWYGDYKISKVHHLKFLKFYKGLEKMHDLIKNTVTKLYLDSVLQASKDYYARLGCSTDNWTLDNVFEYFSNKSNIHVPYKKLQVSDSNKIYNKYSDVIVKNINEFKIKANVDAERMNDIKASDALRRVISGECAVEKLCLKCLSFPKGRMEEHPFFIGFLCKECSDVFKPCMFVYGKDGKCLYCTVCASAGSVLICDADNCQRVYCTACLKFLVCPKSYDEILLEDPWHCFFCRDESKQPDNMLLRPRLDWKEKLPKMFRTVSNPASDDAVLLKCKEKRPIRVLSLFDGLSTGFLVLLNLRIVVDVYYASEVDTDVMAISSAHFGDRITQLGDVRNITKEKIQEIAPIDLLIGGSPCNDLSLVNPARRGLHDPNGTGILFFEYTRIKDLVTKANKDRHMFWLYENVASMPSQYRLEINKHFGQEPDVIDAADFSPQRRLRLYWHNLPFNPYMPLFQNQQDVQDKLTPNLNRRALCKKLRTVTTQSNSLLQSVGKNKKKTKVNPIMMNGVSDKLWITEIEEIFGFPRHYTDVNNLSVTKRQKFLGKSWSVQTLIAILRPLCSYFKCNENETSNNISTLYENISPLYHGKRF